MKKVVKNKNGFTLVELVVTFALLALFCVAVLYLAASSMGIFRSATEHAYAQTVSQTLLDKMAGEVSGAQPGANRQNGVTVSAGPFTAADDSCISLCGRTGSRIYITADRDGYLLIHYRPVTDNDRNLKAVDWKFDSAVYNGYVIDSLGFSIVRSGGANTNVIRISLTLRNTRTGYTYSSERYAQCFNFEDATAVAKISYGSFEGD